MLNFIDHPGPDAVPPLMIAHGLFGSARNWGIIAKRLSDKRRVIVVITAITVQALGLKAIAIMTLPKI